ncbi:MAG: PepSY domain-containing protein, partial [Gammaproteobacteria bacterium]|nr:PepSY domain-containing protein [Gammaproteobacteria bacterium]
MNRTVFLLHRYLGIALGLVVSVWCLSGFVMMYVQYPELTPEQQATSLAPLDLTECCRLPADLSAIAHEPLESLRIEPMAGRPLLRLVLESGERYQVDLAHGKFIDGIGESGAAAVAASYAGVAGIDGFEFQGQLPRDQWTVYGAYDVHRPLFKFSGNDDAGTEWYVSSRTGEVVQWTTASQRFWNWLGAVPHWLYPTLLRQHTLLWSQLVIWLTIFGTFLTVLGVYVGVRQFKARRSGRYSPYRGAALWHHYAGLVMGVFTLIWLVSGFFSMQPWGTLESRSFEAERDRYQGVALTLADALPEIRALAGQAVPEGTVRLEMPVVAGERMLIAWDGQGRRSRLGHELRPVMPAIRQTVDRAAAMIRPGIDVLREGWIAEHDAYYYSHHDDKALPVYRIVYADRERYYLDPVTGAIVHAVDTNGRWYRWFHYALHRGDFTEFVRSRPIWDLMML